MLLFCQISFSLLHFEISLPNTAYWCLKPTELTLSLTNSPNAHSSLRRPCFYRFAIIVSLLQGRWAPITTEMHILKCSHESLKKDIIEFFFWIGVNPWLTVSVDFVNYTKKLDTYSKSILAQFSYTKRFHSIQLNSMKLGQRCCSCNVLSTSLSCAVNV